MLFDPFSNELFPYKVLFIMDNPYPSFIVSHHKACIYYYNGALNESLALPPPKQPPLSFKVLIIVVETP